MRKIIVAACIAAMVATACIFSGKAAAQDRDGRGGNRAGRGANSPRGGANAEARNKTLSLVANLTGKANNGPAAGAAAPDFSLVPLKFYEFNIDDTEITKENAGALYNPVTLSDFKGKKPVVLIFGSYT